MILPQICSVINPKFLTMQKLLLFKEIYLEAFKNLGNLLLTKYFKFFFWFCFAMLLVVMYAFSYRIATGFVFD